MLDSIDFKTMRACSCDFSRSFSAPNEGLQNGRIVQKRSWQHTLLPIGLEHDWNVEGRDGGYKSLGRDGG